MDFMVFLNVRKVKNLHSKNSWQGPSLQFLHSKPITVYVEFTYFRQVDSKFISQGKKNGKNSDSGFAKHFIGQILLFLKFYCYI